MEPTFTTQPAFTVVGLKYRGKNENKQDIPQLWEQLNPRAAEVQHRADPHTAYGIIGNFNPITQEFDYLAGFAVTSTADQPTDMAHWAVPEQHYAVFKTNLATLHADFEFIYHTWLPRSDYEHTDGPEFELYDASFHDPTAPFYLYIPVHQP